MRPRSMTAMRWAPRTAAGRWAMTRTVRPRTRALSASWISASDSGSAMAVASSMSRTGVSSRIARAMAMRCSCPPDRAVSRPRTVS